MCIVSGGCFSKLLGHFYMKNRRLQVQEKPTHLSCYKKKKGCQKGETPNAPI